MFIERDSDVSVIISQVKEHRYIMEDKWKWILLEMEIEKVTTYEGKILLIINELYLMNYTYNIF